jgi:hypothetical protein
VINSGEEFLRLGSELMAEEQSGPVNGLSELALRMERREELGRQIACIERELCLLRQRFERLPILPSLTCIRWAQSVLAYPNGRIMTVDTIYPAEDAHIINVLLLDFDGAVRFDGYVATGRTLSRQEVQTPGITSQNLREALPLPHMWPLLLDALMGRYVVSYNFEHARRVLEKNAEQYGLDPPTMIGDCLLKQCLRYFQAAGFVGLGSLCDLVGYPLPVPPDCTAVDRARGQLYLLQAMAKGLTGGSKADSILSEQDDDSQNDHYDGLLLKERGSI